MRQLSATVAATHGCVVGYGRRIEPTRPDDGMPASAMNRPRAFPATILLSQISAIHWTRLGRPEGPQKVRHREARRSLGVGSSGGTKGLLARGIAIRMPLWQRQLSQSFDAVRLSAALRRSWRFANPSPQAVILILWRKSTRSLPSHRPIPTHI